MGEALHVFPVAYSFKKGTFELKECSESKFENQPTMAELLKETIQIELIRFEPVKSQEFSKPPVVTLGWFQDGNENTVALCSRVEAAPELLEFTIYRLVCDIELNPNRKLKITADADGIVMIYKTIKQPDARKELCSPSKI